MKLHSLTADTPAGCVTYHSLTVDLPLQRYFFGVFTRVSTCICIRLHHFSNRGQATVAVLSSIWCWCVGSCPRLQVKTNAHTHTHTCNPSQPRTVWHTVYTIRILHAIGDGTLWCTTCNRGRFVYEYDSSLITGDVTGAHKFSSFVNVLYIRFAIDCTNSQGGDRPRFQNVPGLIVKCHTYVPVGGDYKPTHTHSTLLVAEFHLLALNLTHALNLALSQNININTLPLIYMFTKMHKDW